MELDPTVLLTILGMALVTYATRAGGLILMRRVPLSPRVQAGLRTLPATTLLAIVAPTVLGAGLPEALASLAAVLVAWRTRNLLGAMIAGVVVVWLARRLLGGG